MRRHPLAIVAASMLIVLFSFAPLAFADFSYGAGGGGGVKLQAASPGSFQTGNLNLKGNGIYAITQPPPANVWQGSALYHSFGGLYLSGTSNVGAVIAGGWNDSLDIFPNNYNSALSSSGVLYGWYGPKSTQRLMQWNFDTVSAGGGAGVSCSSGVGCVSTIYSGCGSGASPNGAPCVSTSTGNGISTPLYLGGQVGVNGPSNKVVTTTGNVTVTSGNLFEWQNGGIVEASMDVGGVLSSNGLNAAGPVTIGAGGTAISGTFRGTASWTPGTIASGAQATTTITVTGAATGADCITGVVSPAPLTGRNPQCEITAANTCTLALLNQGAASVTLGAATFYCRAFNP